MVKELYTYECEIKVISNDTRGCPFIWELKGRICDVIDTIFKSPLDAYESNFHVYFSNYLFVYYFVVE